MTVSSPLVSIVVPIYNVESYLSNCLDSIKQQTYHNLEVILVEDCSTDNSKSVLEPYLEDYRFKLIEHNHNSGLSAARNSGIKQATGEYIMFVDSDDFIDPRLVEACVKYANCTDANIIVYNYEPFKDGIKNDHILYTGEISQTQPTLIATDYFNLPHFAWLKFIRLKTIKNANISFPVGLYYEDWPFHWHLGLVTEKIYHLPIKFYLYRQRGTSITGSNDEKMLDLFKIHFEVMKLIEKYDANELKQILANKVRSSHWIILNNINNQLLSQSIRLAKKSEKQMLLRGYPLSQTFKHKLISKILNMPNVPALLSIKGLRFSRKLRAFKNKL